MNSKHLPNLSFSHIELMVRDLGAMETFYTKVLGFVVTDRGEAQGGMLFISRNPNEHHQIVLNPLDPSHANSNKPPSSPVDHFAFRVDSLSHLRAFYQRLVKSSGIELTSVSHGNSWSIYFKDPEMNRFEIFTDTPWHVDQPCRFEVDLNLDDEALIKYTENKVSSMQGFSSIQQWHKIMSQKISPL